jgi:hypothetical protein
VPPREYFTGFHFGSIFVRPLAALNFHDLNAQERGALELQVRAGALHFFFQFAQHSAGTLLFAY